MEMSMERIIEIRFGTRAAKDFRTAMQAIKRDEAQITDIQLMAEIAYRFRHNVKKRLQDYGQWKASYPFRNTVVERTYYGYEGIVKLEALERSWRLYKVVQSDYAAALKAANKQDSIWKQREKEFYGHEMVA